MIRILTLLFLLFFHSFLANAGQKEDITKLILRWNEAHNSKRDSVFKEIYADWVLFYGRESSRNSCAKKKKTLLKKYFDQQLTSNIIITEYSSGIFKCDFTKKVITKQDVKSYDCYLLVKKVNGHFRIVGESDLVTDKNLNVHLTLGEVVVPAQPTRKVSDLNIFITILVLLISGFYLWGRVEKNREKSQFNKRNRISQSFPLQGYGSMQRKPRERVGVVVHEKSNYSSVSSEEEEHIKGVEFERYVVSRFKKDFFELVEWRSDKYHNGVYASSSRLPDLEYRFKTKFYDLKFAVECKWRAYFLGDHIEWAKIHQMSTYRQYESERGIFVFVLIGIGGEPGNPENVYVVPLSEIHSTVLYRHELIKYKRYKTGNFYLDAVNMKLD